MTEREKLISHTDRLIEELYCLYKEYRRTIVYDEDGKENVCQVLKGCALGLAQDFNELERMKIYDERPKYNENQ